jgi:uncharacterized protein (TIGR02145 family)
MKKSFLLLFSFCLYSCSDYASDYENVWGNFFSGNITEEDLFSSSSSVQSFDNYPSPISSSDFFNDYNPIASSSSSEFYLSSSEIESSSLKMLILSSSSVRSSSSIENFINSLRDSRDGQTYKYVKIGNQVWMAENLNYKIDGSYCYESFTQNCEKYGRLYSKLSALHACPEGWHLPSGKEFRTLLVNVGGEDVAGRMLKSPTGWYDYNGESGNGIDAFGFNALPAGYFSNDNGDFISAHEEAYFLGATDDWSEETAMLNLSNYRGVSASQLSEKKRMASPTIRFVAFRIPIMNQ